MQGAAINIGTMRARIAIVLITLALALRVLIPSGFMPATGQGFAIQLCIGANAVSAWLDSEGRIHKGEPAPDRMADHPCAFAGLSAVLDLARDFGPLALPASISSALPLASIGAVAVGRGLAAPPPPSTGPPASR